MADAAVAVVPAADTKIPAGVAFTPPAEVAKPAVPAPAKAEPATPTLLDGVVPKAGEPVKPEAPKAEPVKDAPKTEPVKADYSKLEVPKDSLFPATHKEKIAAFASKHSLSPEVAQEVMKQQSQDLKEYVDTQVKGYEATKQKWADELKAHPKFGGDQLAAYNQGATEVLNKYGTPELMKSLQETGFAYKVEVAQFLSNIWNAMKPDKMVAPGTRNSPGQADMSQEAVAKRMFPKSNHV